jgi:hypothetical protein
MRKTTWGQQKGQHSLLPHTTGSMLLYKVSCSQRNITSLLYSFLLQLQPEQVPMYRTHSYLEGSSQSGSWILNDNLLYILTYIPIGWNSAADCSLANLVKSQRRTFLSQLCQAAKFSNARVLA